jgi:hypothetical protein
MRTQPLDDRNTCKPISLRRKVLVPIRLTVVTVVGCIMAATLAAEPRASSDGDAGQQSRGPFRCSSPAPRRGTRSGNALRAITSLSALQP